MDINEPDDPHNDCIAYPDGQTQETCTATETSKKIFDILNCYPPWLNPMESDSVCRGRLNVSWKVKMKVIHVIERVKRSKSSPHCPRPCNYLSYLVTHDHIIQNFDFPSSLVIIFDETMKIKTSNFAITTQSFLSRIGGAIGFSRTIFWLLVTLLTIFKTFFSFCFRPKE